MKITEQRNILSQNAAKVVSDEEIDRVHRGNFGGMTNRNVVNDGVRKASVGYHCGHTQFSILRDHGLITKPRGMSEKVNLTQKGKKYARVLWHLDRLSLEYAKELLDRWDATRSELSGSGTVEDATRRFLKTGEFL